MLRTRVVTAIILIGVLGAVLLYAPPWVFEIFVIGAITCALYEFYRLVFPTDLPYRLLGCLYGVGVAATVQWASLGVPLPLTLLIGCFLVSVVHLLRSLTFERFVSRVGATCFGAVYIALGMSYFGWLREAEHGRALVTMTIGMVALSDTFAYAVGRTMGRQKLAPLVSPNKTVAGFVAGFAGSVVAALTCRMLLWPALSIGSLMGLGLLIGVIAPLGDLIESAVKRGAHVKDSGTLLPGHGGLFDRADAYIFSAPAVYYYVKYVMGVI